MNCLIVAATAAEIAGFMDYYRKTEPAFNHEIDVLITGIGLTATTYNLTKYFSLKRPDHVIQAGIAGSFDKTILPGSIVAVKKDTIADEAVVEEKKLKTLFDLGLISANHFPYKNRWLVNPDKKIFNQHKYKAINAISVNQVSTDKKMIGFYKENFQPSIESMEGAAFHYVCLSEKIPFLQIRSISNYVGERNKKNWKMKESITNLNNELVRLLKSL
jgi:futalosine hydrolase